MKRFKHSAIKVVIGYLVIAYSIFIFDDSTIIFLGREDGFYEVLTAMFFLSASILFFISYIRERGGNDFFAFKTKKNIFFLLLSLVFLMGFGEEISWGQRIFNIDTPEELKQINMQNELNIHNISIFHGRNADGKAKGFVAKMLNIDRLFSLFWLSFCVVVPLVAQFNAGVNSFLQKINLPIVPLWLSAFFVINYLISKVYESIINDEYSGFHHTVVEIKECNLAFLFAIVSLFMVLQIREKKLQENHI